MEKETIILKDSNQVNQNFDDDNFDGFPENFLLLNDKDLDEYEKWKEKQERRQITRITKFAETLDLVILKDKVSFPDFSSFITFYTPDDGLQSNADFSSFVGQSCMAAVACLNEDCYAAVLFEKCHGNKLLAVGINNNFDFKKTKSAARMILIKTLNWNYHIKEAKYCWAECELGKEALIKTCYTLPIFASTIRTVCKEKHIVRISINNAYDYVENINGNKIRKIAYGNIE